MVENVIGKYVTYFGSQADWHGREFKITDQGVGSNVKRIAFEVDGQKVWRTWNYESFSAVYGKPKDMSLAAAEAILDPMAPAKQYLDSKIKRLRERIAELEAAKKVLNTL